MIAAYATQTLPAPSGLPPIAVPRYPEVRHRDAFDREYLLDVAAAATVRTQPGSLPACWPLLDDRDHVEAICRDYGELDVEHRFTAEQLEEAQRRAVAAERARDQAIAARDQAVADLARERERHATTQRVLAETLEHAVGLQARNLRLSVDLAVTRDAMAAIYRRYRALRVAVVIAEVLEALDVQRWSARAERRGGFTTGDDVDDTLVIDVDEVAATGGAR